MTATRKAVLQELVTAGRLEIIHIEREETKQADTLAALISLGPLNGYSDAGQARKKKFHSIARRKLRKLANELGLTAKDYKLSTNPGGIAVAGETTLHTDTFYLQISQSCFGRGSEIMYRACAGRGDYCGRQNYYAEVSQLDDPAAFALELRHMARFGFAL
jgi:hypothetical protein